MCTEAEASLLLVLLRSKPPGTLYATLLRLRTTLRCGKSHTRVRTPPLPPPQPLLRSPVRTPLLPRASVSCAIAAVIVAVVVGVPRCRRPEKGNFCPPSQWRRCDSWLAALLSSFHIVVALWILFDNTNNYSCVYLVWGKHLWDFQSCGKRFLFVIWVFFGKSNIIYMKAKWSSK